MSTTLVTALSSKGISKAAATNGFPPVATTIANFKASFFIY